MRDIADKGIVASEGEIRKWKAKQLEKIKEKQINEPGE